MQNRKKRLIILSAILCGVLVIILLASTLFSLKSVRIEFKNARYALDEEYYTENYIVDSGKFKFGSNLLFYEVNTAKANIEKSIGYAEVIKIERIFPNSITVHIAERQPCVLIKSEDLYFVLDKNLKILHVSNQENLLEINNEKYCPLLYVENLNLEDKQMGDFLENSNLKEILTQIFNCAYMASLSMGHFMSVKITVDELSEVVTRIDARPTYGGGYIEIVGTNDLQNKMISAFAIFSNFLSSSSPNFEYIKVTKGGQVSSKNYETF